MDRAGTFFSALSQEELQSRGCAWEEPTDLPLGSSCGDQRSDGRDSGDLVKDFIQSSDAMFVLNPDKTVHLTVSAKELKHIWDEINEAVWMGFCRLSPSEWLEKHTAVSNEDFIREPHRNRFAVLLGRTAHLAYHFGTSCPREAGIVEVRKVDG